MLVRPLSILLNHMADHIIHPYRPNGVTEIIAVGSSSFIGRLHENRVLKYPLEKGDEWSRFVLEEQIYQILGDHPRILKCYGLNEDGLSLEYAPGGSIEMILAREKGAICENERLRWGRQATEVVVHMHQRNVIHRDLSTKNLLLDGDRNVKLSDFQGLYVDVEGVTHDGYAGESSKASLPRQDHHSNVESDLFALGSTIYEIMAGHEPFPELHSLDDSDEIEKRFSEGHFPSTEYLLGGHIIDKCWRLVYKDCDQCLQDLLNLEETLSSNPQTAIVLSR